MADNSQWLTYPWLQQLKQAGVIMSSSPQLENQNWIEECKIIEAYR